MPEANRRVGEAGSGKQGCAQNLGIGTDRQRIAVGRISARQHDEAPCPIRFWETATAPTRRPAALTGQQPDLKKLELVGAVIVLRMADSGSCAHHLDVARPCAADVARTIFVRDDAVANIADDFHIRMTVPAKAGARRISSSFQTTRAPGAIRRIAVRRNNEVVARLQPATIALIECFFGSNLQHDIPERGHDGSSSEIVMLLRRPDD